MQEFKVITAIRLGLNFCFVPKSTVCYTPMKPHTLYCDEEYNEHYYRKLMMILSAKVTASLLWADSLSMSCL